MSKRSQRVCQQIAVKNFKDKHYEQINLTVNKGERDVIKAAATEAGLSVNGFICAAISDRLGFRVGLNAKQDKPTKEEEPDNAGTSATTADAAMEAAQAEQEAEPTEE